MWYKLTKDLTCRKKVIKNKEREIERHKVKLIPKVVLRWTKKELKKISENHIMNQKSVYKKRSVIKKIKIQKNKICNKTEKNLNKNERNDG